MNEEYLSKEEASRMIHNLLDEQDDRGTDDQDEP